MTKKFKVVNKSVIKQDGPGLVSGQSMFVDDINLKDMLIGKILCSPHAHAVIEKIDTSAAEKLPGVHCVLTYKNVPRVPHTTAGQGYPEPSPYDTYLLDKKVRYVGDRVAAVAAETEEIAEEAISKIKVKYKVLEPVFDAEKAMDKDMPVIHDEKDAKVIIPIKYDPKRNLAAEVSTQVGDVEKGLKDADYVFVNKYSIHYASHAAIEPHITITYLDAYGRLIIRTSTQVPFHVRRIVAQTLKIPMKKIRVIKPRIGGGFGGKQEILLEDICSLLTLRTKRPVKINLTRSEDLVSSRTRHPQIINLRTGIKKNGDLTAIDLDIIMNTGAYGSHALTVVCNSGSKVLPLYKCKNVKFRGRTVYTNLPVGGAYRGYGATQAYFAIGTQMDEMARQIGMDIVDLYKKIHIREGEGSPIFQALGEGKEGVEQTIGSSGLNKCIDLGVKEIGWKKKKRRYIDKYHRRGYGMVILMQGSSVPEIDMGAASIKMNEDGSFNLLVGATDLGTGSDTILAQIAAEVLTVPADKVITYSSDTDLTPFDVGAYASSTTYLSGYAVLKTAEKVKKQIINVAAEMFDTAKKNITIKNGKAYYNRKSLSFSDICTYAMYENNQFQIMSTDSHITHKSPPPFSAHFAEISVNIITGKVEVLKYVAAIDCGTPIHPKSSEGQVEGSVLNGLSYALCEEYIFNKKGKMLNDSFQDFKIFTTRDVPNIKTILVETYEPTGPFGAKSVSEICINGPAPVIANAIYDAVGVRLRQAPFTQDVVLEAMNGTLSE